ncbi:Pentatricopeptide repeat (PPR) superfamily protein [Quillaja saponaria]|uniref:Pentatricopeptide repeat (PPR) superfamily protein n=1 Tax=Quillaja saponaria TaxID=32244 RepID=A0AAD7Q3M5_QUISA|nr:Pentatricopeptide repeat (PPR) superfamily protein [Quillaja saponaria]
MMMFFESAMAVCFPAGGNTRLSTAIPYCRSMWSTDDVNGGARMASSRNTCTGGGFDMPRSGFRRTKGTQKNLVKNGIRASSKNLGSASEPLKNEKPSYHPFEEIDESTIGDIGDARLTAAETSRTIVEVNNKATLMFSSLINDEVHENIICPDLPYLTDEHGNVYFQVNNGEDVFQSLTSENNYVQVIVGVDTMEMISEMDLSGSSEIDFGIEEIEDEDSGVEDDTDEEEEDDEDDNDDYDTDWVAVLEDEDEEDDSDEALGDWAKLETMRSSHPMYFAKKLARVASDDPVDWMENPPASLAIQGIIRPVFVEEHSVIQKHLSGHQSSNADTSQLGNTVEAKGEEHGVVYGGYDSGSSKDNEVGEEESENNNFPINGTSFYKLEIITIQQFSSYGNPTVVELEDYMKAQPDAIAHSAAKIISRLNAGGEKTTQALKSLCWTCKGIQVEEAALISVDSVGFDLRVCSGTQVQMLRFSFNKKATSEYSAERQLNDLLFSRIHQKVQKKQ